MTLTEFATIVVVLGSLALVYLPVLWFHQLDAPKEDADDA